MNRREFFSLPLLALKKQEEPSLEGRLSVAEANILKLAYSDQLLGGLVLRHEERLYRIENPPQIQMKKPKGGTV